MTSSGTTEQCHTTGSLAKSGRHGACLAKDRDANQPAPPHRRREPGGSENSCREIGTAAARDETRKRSPCSFRMRPLASGPKAWKNNNAHCLNAALPLWVKPEYGGYRRAYKLACPDERIRVRVRSPHNEPVLRCLAGFAYVRVLPISRSANSSSGFSENWGVHLTVGARQP